MKSRATSNSRRASGLEACRSMNSGCASLSTARSLSSEPKPLPIGRRMAGCVQHRTRHIARSSASISYKISVANPAVCWPERPVAPISPNSAPCFPPPPSRLSPAKCGTLKKALRPESHRTTRPQTVRHQLQTNRLSNSAVATHCVSTARLSGNTIHGGSITRPEARASVSWGMPARRTVDKTGSALEPAQRIQREQVHQNWPTTKYQQNQQNQRYQQKQHESGDVDHRCRIHCSA